MITNQTERLNFASTKNIPQYPDFLDVQVKSFQDFFQLETKSDERGNEGLYNTFMENFPITDTRNQFVLEFLDYFVDPPRYTIQECIERGLTYSVPLKARLKLYCTDPEHEDFETIVQDVYLGTIPYMTPSGTFVINGAERVVVSQLHRSPGVFFGQSFHANGTKLYSARVIPFKGSWIEFATDINNVMYAYIDRKKKLPVTTLLRAIGFERDKDILEIFDLAEEIKVSKTGLKKYVGRKLAARVLNTWHEDFVDEDTGEVVSIERNEIILDRDTILDKDNVEEILDADVKLILLHKEENNQVDYAIIHNTLQKDPTNSEKEAVEHIYRQLRNAEPPDEETARGIIDKLFFSDQRYNLGEVGRYRMNKKLNLDIPMEKQVLTKEDIITIIKYLIELINAKADIDDIDHLSNRRVRTVGEQLSQQFGVGLARMARTIRERMNVRDNEVFTPIDLINAKTLSSVINSFFGTNQLSQFMDQTNPLAEITHKRRLSALGPGGLSRERAGFEVRDVHYTHYGRLCPIETPEGPNIGLISSLGVYAKVNGMGFIETPYRKVTNGQVDLVSEPIYLSAEEEEGKMIAQANIEMDAKGNITADKVIAREEGDFPVVEPSAVHYTDVAPNQIASISASLIPFLEHDDANRALMGSNMMRQAVPLLRAEAPFVGTGMEFRAAVDAGDVTLGRKPGVVTEVQADEVTVMNDDGTNETYFVDKFVRSNQGTSRNQKIVVAKGDRVEVGSVIADGPSTDKGEMALGKNLLVAFMSWEGHNYEDAIILSQRLVQDDVLTSIHIEEYEVDARDTKLGPEEITRDIPNVSEEVLADLDERGIIRVGADVVPGDILVGKVTPKGETELTPEERLLRAIFGEKAREVRDTSLKVPHGESGKVIGVSLADSEDYELPAGVNQVVRVYVAQKRKIQDGDKLAGRHGNKGVISKILPQEDMPFLEDGTPVDVVLNPLGVPGRMNVGQVLETHLGWVAKSGWKLEGNEDWQKDLREHGFADVAAGSKVATPVFDGAKEEELIGLLGSTLPNKDGMRLIGANGKAQLFDGRTGEPYKQPITVGYMYILKLHHLVDDKIHARSTGPYSMITQQPLGGKAQFGGQRFGEMEVWALEAYGAAYTLQELLTIKSDDVLGRVKVYEAIVKGENIPEPGIPESFKVLVKEMQSLCLNVEVLNNQGIAIEMRDTDEEVFRAAEELGINLSRVEPSSVEEV